MSVGEHAPSCVNRLKETIHYLGKSVEQVAKDLSMSKRTLYNYVHGKVVVPDDLRSQFAAYLGCTQEFLFPHPSLWLSEALKEGAPHMHVSHRSVNDVNFSPEVISQGILRAMQELERRNMNMASLPEQDTSYSGRETIQTRRQTLHHLLMVGSMALVLAPHPALSPRESEQLHLSILEELEKITASYWRLCTNTSLDLLGNLAEHFHTVIHLFQRALPYATTQRLCSLSGEIAQILGKTLFDLQEYTLAHSYYLFSLKAAQSASNHDLWATGIGRIILLLIYWGQPQQALPLLQEVRQLDVQSTGIVCWLAIVEAEVHASLGDAVSCDAALKKAKNIAEHTLFGEDRYATGFSVSRLAGYEGACFVRLRQPDRALPALQRALSLLDSQAIRRRSTLLTDIGIAYAQQGEIQKACQVALQVLSITKQTRSRAVLDRVRTVRTELEAWKETNEVHDLEKHLDTTSAFIAG